MDQFFDRKHVLVTGGAGFIGCNLVRRLLKEGARVRVFDNFSTGKRSNLSDLQESDSGAARSAPVRSREASSNRAEGASPSPMLEVFEGDLRDFALILEATKDIEIVFHEAALPSVIRSVKAPNTTNDVNIAGTLNLLEACKVNNVKRVIYASSSSIYGDSEELPKHEKMIPKPMSPYAVSKIAGEHYMRVFHHLYGIETVILRYFNVYGPYQDPTSEYSGVISKFIHAFINNQPITVYGDGEQSRDFTYVDDVVEANILAADAPVSGEVFNVAGGNRYSLNQMIEILKDIFGKKEYEVIYTDPRPGDVRHSQAAVESAKKRFAFTAKIDFDAGLKKTVEWYNQSVGI
jgi:UDP-N-acetylglucosamine 4-epimerase